MLSINMFIQKNQGKPGDIWTLFTSEAQTSFFGAFCGVFRRPVPEIFISLIRAK